MRPARAPPSRQPEREDDRGWWPCGYDAGKKIKGRKRHAMVDTDGRALELQVGSASVQDRDGAVPLLQASRRSFPLVGLAFADTAYATERVRDATCIAIEIVRKIPGQVRFEVHPRRWVVERCFAWLGRRGHRSTDEVGSAGSHESIQNRGVLSEARGRTGGRPRRRALPSAVIRRSIAVRTFDDWHDLPPGFMEADLVAHSGPTAKGSFMQTLTLTDIAVGWTECAPVLVREQALLTKVLSEMRKLLAFALLGFDTVSRRRVHERNGAGVLHASWGGVAEERRRMWSGTRSATGAMRTWRLRRRCSGRVYASSTAATLVNQTVTNTRSVQQHL